LHRFDTAHECDGRTDGRPDDGKDARSILLSRVKIHNNEKDESTGQTSMFRFHVNILFGVSDKQTKYN